MRKLLLCAAAIFFWATPLLAADDLLPDLSQFKVRYLCQDVASNPPKAVLDHFRQHDGDMHAEDNAYLDVITVFGGPRLAEFFATENGKSTVRHFVNTDGNWKESDFLTVFNLLNTYLPGYSGKSFKCKLM